LGPLIINGPATADYDEDLGILDLTDWGHETASSLWDTARQGAPPTLQNTLINGTNTYNGLGSKFEMVFEAGKKYRIRLLNSAIEAHFQFSIDGHSMTVIGMDLVPLVPYATDSVVISMGQRYDIIVEANATSGDYWLRGGWITACSTNSNPANMTGIVRYDSSSTADPTTTSTVTTSTNCGDEPYASLVPYLAMNVGNFTDADVTQEALSFAFSSYFTWTINSTSLYLNWSDPTIIKIFNDDTIWPTEYNVEPIDVSSFVFHDDLD
jgi:FtsP/CotA-like multicopper oxidase with cupredoxin domain